MVVTLKNPGGVIQGAESSRNPRGDILQEIFSFETEAGSMKQDSWMTEPEEGGILEGDSCASDPRGGMPEAC